MENQTTIIPLLLALQQLFVDHQLGSWARRTERTIYLLNENQFDSDLVLDNYIGSGMDSLQFVEIENEDLEAFDQLRTTLLQQNQLLKSARNS